MMTSTEIARRRAVRFSRLRALHARFGDGMRYIDHTATAHYLAGHSFQADVVAQALDEVLERWDHRTGEPSAMLAAIRSDPGMPLPQTLFVGRPRTLVVVGQVSDGTRGVVTTELRETSNGAGLTPLVVVTLVSRALAVPMRVEVPLRALLMETPAPQGTYTVYQHLFEDDDGAVWTYYGLTKRGWNERFVEHLAARKATGAKRRVSRKLAELTDHRLLEPQGVKPPGPALRSIASVLCAVGLTMDQADDLEEHFIAQHTLHAHHPQGLNDCPGGKAGKVLAMSKRLRAQAARGARDAR